MKKLLLLAAVSAPAMFIATPAAASIIQYDVTDATDSSCPHGLWVNSLRSRCDKKFSFQDGTTFTQDTAAGTASFTGTAINRSGEVATLNLSFSGFQDEILAGQVYKRGTGGLPYNPATMDFYSDASGSITIEGTTYTLNPAQPLSQDNGGRDTTLQIGPGSNYFSSDFGGSAWLNILDPSGKSLPHFDINFDLALRPGTPVPAPGALALFGLALAGVWAGRRRRRVTA